jgi:hypothetical protein
MSKDSSAAKVAGECTVCGGQNGNHAPWCGHSRSQ